MRKILLAPVFFGLLVTACADISAPTLTPEERVLVLCEGWSNVFRTINLRDQINVAKPAEIAAINAARPIMNPTCLNLTPPSGFGLADIEVILIETIKASQEKG